MCRVDGTWELTGVPRCEPHTCQTYKCEETSFKFSYFHDFNRTFCFKNSEGYPTCGVGLWKISLFYFESVYWNQLGGGRSSIQVSRNIQNILTFKKNPNILKPLTILSACVEPDPKPYLVQKMHLYTYPSNGSFSCSNQYYYLQGYFSSLFLIL